MCKIRPYHVCRHLKVKFMTALTMSTERSLIFVKKMINENVTPISLTRDVVPKIYLIPHILQNKHEKTLTVL